MVVVLNNISYYGNNTSIGYSVESIERDGHVTYSLHFEAHLVDEHYILQEAIKFQARKEKRASPNTNFFGVAHSKEEAENRIYDTALNEARNMACRFGETLDNKVSQPVQAVPLKNLS